jgi:hypothetical protein
MSDGGCSDGDGLQPLTPQAPPLMIAQDVMEMALQKNWIPIIEVPPQLHPFSRTPKFISVDVGTCFGFGGLEVVAASQVACEDLMTVKAKT